MVWSLHGPALSLPQLPQYPLKEAEATQLMVTCFALFFNVSNKQGLLFIYQQLASGSPGNGAQYPLCWRQRVSRPSGSEIPQGPTPLSEVIFGGSRPYWGRLI